MYGYGIYAVYLVNLVAQRPRSLVQQHIHQCRAYLAAHVHRELYGFHLAVCVAEIVWIETYIVAAVAQPL